MVIIGVQDIAKHGARKQKRRLQCASA